MVDGSVREAVFWRGEVVLSDIINLGLRVLGLAIVPRVGLVLKGSIDQVRENARRFRFLPVNGVEIIGSEVPIDPSCHFLVDIQRLRHVRLFASSLTDIEALASLPVLQDLRIMDTRRNQTIPLDLSICRALKHLTIEWFQGANSLFRARELESLNLIYYPGLTSQELGSLRCLSFLRLVSCRLTEIEALRQVSSLRWLALLNLRKLQSLKGISRHPGLRFLWLEGCPKIGTLDWLREMPSLETLQILDCGKISGTEALLSLPHLRHIHIHGSTKIDAMDFSLLRNLPNLESVFIRGLPRIEAEYWRKRNKKYDLLRRDLGRR